MKKLLGITAAAGLLAAFAGGLLERGTPVAFANDANTSDKPAGVAVESDMHEFMEYVFQPTYKRLKANLAFEPADNQDWNSIKSDALILAEGGNLLLIRPSEEDRNDWAQHSTKVRDWGGQLYRAAKSKDYSTARKTYESMLTHCNACHQQFAGGEHQLKP